MKFNNIKIPLNFKKDIMDYRPIKRDMSKVKNNYPKRNSLNKHIDKLNYQYNSIIDDIESIENNIVVEVEGQNGKDTTFETLDNFSQGIRLLQIKKRDKSRNNNSDKAIIKIPKLNKDALNEKLYNALVSEKTNGVDYNIANTIENIYKPSLRSYWTSIEPIPDGTFFAEVWLMNDYFSRKKEYRSYSAEEDFMRICRSLKIKTMANTRLEFNEIIIRLIRVTKDQLEGLVQRCESLSEIRLHKEPNTFYSNLNTIEQEQWIDDFSRRVISSSNIKSYISILDKGINRHTLLDNHVSIRSSVNKSWGTYDDPQFPHGSYMAGVCLFYNLNDIMTKNETILLEHKIESIKILPEYGHTQTPRELYGEVTNRAISILNIENPSANRVICMAVTSDDDKQDGSPSSWSAEIDRISYEENLLFIISGGNIYPEQIEEGLAVLDGQDTSLINDSYTIQNPAQAWNALTVGGYTDLDLLVNNDNENIEPLVMHGDISPYSRTSTLWHKKWGIKPDVVCEAGNAALDKLNNTIESLEDFSLMTTNSNSLVESFKFINGTSPATAQVSYIAANIMNKYPELWPQTVRGLIVHSADWTKKMKSKYLDNHTKSEYSNLLKKCGYGVPSLERAINTVENRVNLIIEDTIKPYDKKSMNEMHLHEIPWPEDILRELGDVEATMKITLSYFIEPYPGERGWNNRYRYSSAGLRFEVKAPLESKSEFTRRVNQLAREEKGEKFNSGAERWTIGSETRNSSGSIHKDIWTGNAAELSDCKYIAVYPVMGWWRELVSLKKYNNDLKYSLLVSIETEKEDVKLYTAIKNQIDIYNKNLINVQL